MRVIAALLCLSILARHYGYRLLDTSSAAMSWWFYIAGGVQGFLALLLIIVMLNQVSMIMRVVVFFLVLGCIEEFQVAACGALSFGRVVLPAADGLCVDTIGTLPYAVALAFALTWALRGRDESRE